MGLTVSIILLAIGAIAWHHMTVKVLLPNAGNSTDYIKSLYITIPLFFIGNLAWSIAYTTYEWSSLTAFFISDIVVTDTIFLFYMAYVLKEDFNPTKLIGVLCCFIGSIVSQMP